MTLTRRESVEVQVPFGSRSAALDGIRGLAILSVIFYHTLRVNGDGGAGLHLWRFFQESTWCGVDLFFVLSGFLITGILIDSKESEGYFKNFYARRALRIMPLYYATLLVVLVVVPSLFGLQKLPAMYSRLTSNQFWLWFYLQNFFQARGAHQLPGLGHFWTLAVEEQFYWVWPLIVFWTSRRGLWRLCLAICIAAPFVRLILLESGVSAWAIRELTLTRADSLLWGSLGAILIRDKALAARLELTLNVLAAVAALLLFALALPRGFLLYESPEMITAGYSLFGVLFGVLVLFCARSGGLLNRVFSTPALEWLGRYSYAIYIAHPILYLVYDATLAPRLHLNRFVAALVCFAVVTAASCAFAWLSWELLEVRFLRVKKYFRYGSRVNRRMPTQIAPAAAEELPASS